MKPMKSNSPFRPRSRKRRLAALAPLLAPTLAGLAGLLAACDRKHESPAGLDPVTTRAPEVSPAATARPASSTRHTAVQREATDPGPVESKELSLIVESDGIAGVAFELTDAANDPTRRPVFTGQTDAFGRCVVTLAFEVPASPRPKSLALWARVKAPGLQERLSQVRWSKKRERWRAAMKVETGGTLRGRTIDSEGRGVSAQLDLRASEDRKRRSLEPSQYKPLVDGWFEYHFDPLLLGDLVASAPQAGTGVLYDVHLDPRDPPQDLQIEITGPGVLRGRVVDSKGNGVQGLRLSARLAKPQVEDIGGGQAHGWTSTGADGSFEMKALKPAHYRIRVERTGPDASALELTEHPVPADGSELELEYDNPRLIVALRDSTGAPWEGDVRSHYFMALEKLDRWPENATIIVQRCRGSELEGPCFPGLDYLDWTHVGQARFAFELTPDETYAIAVIGSSFASAPRVFRADPRETQLLEVRAGTEPPQAKLRVRIEIDGVEQTGRRSDGPLFEVSVEDESTGLVIAAKERAGTFTLPPGRYRVVARGRWDQGGCFPGFGQPRTLGQAVQSVVLNPQPDSRANHELTLQLGTGGTLSLLTSAEGSPSEQLEADAYTAYDGDSEPAAEVWFQQEGRPPESVLVDHGSFALPDWPLNRRFPSGMLPAGPGILIARLPGHREVRQAIEIRPGETLEVELAFPPPR